ncbi:MAG: hypothetical protein J0H22_02640, partial [Actinobacteria bacterium]|nr:hypothetical protein [Actinomycetota bacterium]
VEMGTRDQVFSNPRHPYTKRLIEAVPVPDPTRRRSRFARLAHCLGDGVEYPDITDA